MNVVGEKGRLHCKTIIVNAIPVKQGMSEPGRIQSACDGLRCAVVVTEECMSWRVGMHDGGSSS